jgi:hypothetical protein
MNALRAFTEGASPARCGSRDLLRKSLTPPRTNALRAFA